MFDKDSPEQACKCFPLSKEGSSIMLIVRDEMAYNFKNFSRANGVLE